MSRIHSHLYAHIHLAKAYEQRGDQLNALQHLKMAKDIAPDPLVVLGDLARVYRECGMHIQAIESCEEALRLDPDNFMARFFRALINADSTHYEEALEELQKLEMEAPDNPKILVAQATVLEKLGEHDKAHDIVKVFRKRHMPRRHRKCIRSSLSPLQRM